MRGQRLALELSVASSWAFFWDDSKRGWTSNDFLAGMSGCFLSLLEFGFLFPEDKKHTLRTPKLVFAKNDGETDWTWNQASELGVPWCSFLHLGVPCRFFVDDAPLVCFTLIHRDIKGRFNIGNPVEMVLRGGLCWP